MKTVALIDHYHIGHHYAFIKLFAKCILELGYKVYVLYPEKENEIKEYLITEGADPSKVATQKIQLKKIQVESFYTNAVSTLFLWRDTKKIIKKCEEDSGEKIDFVFLCWLDDYLSNDLPHQLIDLIIRRPWSGLYFHPWYLLHETTKNRVTFRSIDSVLRSRYCNSVALHDEFLVSKLANRINKPVLLFPEIADTTAPLMKFALADEIKNRAKERIVVGLIGLEKRKGTLFFIEIAKRANDQNFFFFLAGKPIKEEYNTVDFEKLSNFLNQNRENILYFPDYVEEGPKLNAVICSLDILFVLYDNFKSSSNFITKAVFFDKLVIATKNYWIGSVTNKYRIGITVEEGNGIESLNALNILRTHLINDTWDYSLFAEYKKLHNVNALKKSFEECLNYVKN
ncbi:MAG: hypothetical protein HYR67_10390 [Bacteroidetes bacterium]|nr:hypothetical protein [Bacteroidota bacterium]